MATEREPRAWMRRWAFDGITPQKVKNAKGRWVWPKEARFNAVTTIKMFRDDVPLYADEQFSKLEAVEMTRRLRCKP